MPEFCRSCKAPVLWALTPSGARAPIDAHFDSERGNVLLLAPSGLAPDRLAVVLSGAALEQARRNPRADLRLNHWATCPDKAEWRERTDAKRDERVGYPRSDELPAEGSS